MIVAIACGAVGFCDAYGIQAVNYAGPSLRAALGLGPKELGAVFSVSLLGMMFGGFAVGPIADRLGRRMPMIYSTFAFALLTSLTALVAGFWQLLALRLLSGIALGAALPNAYVLAAEFSPVRNRRLTISLLMAGYTGGGLVAGLLAGPLINRFGWPAVFIVGGLAAFATAILAWWVVPESFVRSPPAARSGIFARPPHKGSPTTAENVAVLSAPADERTQLSVGVLFSRAYWPVTAALWLIAFSVMLSVYLFLSWTPVIVHDSGLSLSDAVLITAVFNVGTMVSAIGAGWLMDRFNPAYVLVAFLVLGAAALAAMSAGSKDTFTLEVVSLFIGLGLGGALGGMNLLATTVYPEEGRVTGAGWAISVGRLGSVIGPTLGAAWLMSRHTESGVYLLLAPLLILVAVVAALLLARGVSPAP